MNNERLSDMAVKASDRCDRTSIVTFLYHIFYSFYCPFIATLIVAAEPDITVLINLSNHIIILHDFLLRLKFIFIDTHINHGQSFPIRGFRSFL